MSERLTITIIRRRIEKGINPHLSEKDKIYIIHMNGGWNIENEKGNRTLAFCRTLREVSKFLDGFECGVERVETESPIIIALHNLTRVFLDGRNYNSQNPYMRPEVKAALLALQKAKGLGGDYMDAAADCIESKPHLTTEEMEDFERRNPTL